MISPWFQDMVLHLLPQMPVCNGKQHWPTIINFVSWCSLEKLKEMSVTVSLITPLSPFRYTAENGTNFVLQADGHKRIDKKAAEVFDERLSSYIKPDIDLQIEKDLRAYIQKASRALAG